MGWDAGYYYLLRTFLCPPATAAAAAATRNAPLLLRSACNQTRTDQTATAPPTSCTKYPALPPFGVLLSIKVPFFLSLLSSSPHLPSPPSPLLFQAIPCSWPVYRNPRHFWKRLLLRSTEYGARLLLPTDHLLRSSNCYLRFQCPSPLAPTQAQHKHKHTRALAAASQLLVAP